MSWQYKFLRIPQSTDEAIDFLVSERTKTAFITVSREEIGKTITRRAELSLGRQKFPIPSSYILEKRILTLSSDRDGFHEWDDDNCNNIIVYDEAERVKEKLAKIGIEAEIEPERQVKKTDNTSIYF